MRFRRTWIDFAADGLSGDFKNYLAPPDGNCSATYTYMGASDINTCKFRDDPTCISSGPDIVAGAVHTLSERLDLLDFTINYMTVRQITVKRGVVVVPNIMTTFQCFTADLWFVGLFMEVGKLVSIRLNRKAVTCSSVMTDLHPETPKNDSDRLGAYHAG